MQFSQNNDLNWTVRSEGLVTVSGLHVPDKIAIVREDTAAVLSIMGKDYNAFQNHEMIEILQRVSNQTGLEMKHSGLFGDGEKVFVQLKSDDLKLGNDRIEGYLTGVNSFDGSTSFAFGPSNVTISCTNSFFSAFRGLNTKVRHTKNMGIKIDEICRSLEGMLDEEKKIFDSIVQLSETRVGEGDIENVIRKLFNVKPELDLDDEEMSTVTKNKIDRFYIDLNGELKEKGNNQWGLFSGITKYTTHSMGKDSTKNMENKMFGLYGVREKEIFNELVGAL
jgi:phage/plasmid-like protein (TIGR03299 family)